MPQVREVIELPFAHGRLDWAARRRIAATLRGRFDAAYVLPNSIKSALIPWFAGIPRRIGYRGEGRWGLLNQRLPNAPGRPPMVAFYSALSGEADVAQDRPRLQLDPSEIDQTLSTLPYFRVGRPRSVYAWMEPGLIHG